MSIALDLGLFFRNSKTKLGLSLTQRAILFTLAFRVGSNPKTWIKQTTLAMELGIEERNVKENLAKIKPTGILLIDRQKSDARKNIYRFVDILFNYHQMSDDQKSKVHAAFNDEILINPVDNSKNRGRNHHLSLENRGRNHHLNRGRNHHLSPDEKTLESPVESIVPENEPSPKGKGERNNKILKKHIGRATQIKQDFEYDGKHINLAREYGLDITFEKDKFIDWAKGKGVTRLDWSSTFSNWLRKAYEIKNQNQINFGGIVKRTNESRDNSQANVSNPYKNMVCATTERLKREAEEERLKNQWSWPS